ncbi:MAG: type II toxin-antitoxin system VapC family toxin [Candidatus Rokuibacteriota bacterium]
MDTSALIKRFVSEKGTLLVSALVRRDPPIATAKIAYAEVYAGLARRHRAGDLSASEHTRVCREFEDDWPTYLQVDLRGEILRMARDLVQRHPLRGFDAIHLASALSLRMALGEEIRFVAADARLLRAAASERCSVLNIERTTE